jgi:predicted CopG family antitoxin
MPEISLDEDTIERLDALRVEEESYDEIMTELINIYETEERTLFRGGSP